METEVKTVSAQSQCVKLMSCGKENSGEISEGQEINACTLFALQTNTFLLETCLYSGVIF